MANADLNTLVLLDGGLEGLVALACGAEACVVAGEGVSPVRAAIATDEPARRASAEAQADRFGVALLDLVVPASVWTSRRLIAAGEAAVAAGIGRVVWPVRVDAGRLRVREAATAMDRALLAERLVSLDASEAGLAEVRFETPMVDLDDEQLAELAADMGVAVETCWWWDVAGDEADAERARWRSALGRFGVGVG